MNEISGSVRSVAAVLLAASALLACPSLAAADTMTPIGSFTDTRGDNPTRPGSLMMARYGPYSLPANGQIHPLPATVAAPCTNCRITDFVADLVDTNGNSVNLQQGPMLHHMVLLNQTKPDIVCPSGPGALGERFLAAGNERTHLHLPLNFGYENDSATWRMIYHLVNKSATPQSVYIQAIYRFRSKADTQAATPAWLDIDGCGDSEYTIPTGYSDFHDVDNQPAGGPYTADWALPWDARLLSIAGHSHDVDITGGGACTDHCAEHGGGIAVSAELRGGPATYFGPSPPNNPPPSDITGTTLCRSEANFGTAWAGSAWRGHLDTMGLCGIFTSVPPGAQSEAYPAGGAFPANGVAVARNQVIRVHSEYQNDTGSPQTDVMGILLPWFAVQNVYARPGSATPLRVPLVTEFSQCTAPNSKHVVPLNHNSCNPAVQESAVLTTSLGRQAGFAKLTAVPGVVATPADEADIAISANVTDVRRRSDGQDYVGRVLLTSSVRLTDRQNGPAEGGTVQDWALNVPLNCVSTADTATGSTCSASTTADSLVPGRMIEQKRSIMSLLGMQVKDAGANGTGYASCPPTCGDGDEKVFLRQGLFAP